MPFGSISLHGYPAFQPKVSAYGASTESSNGTEEQSIAASRPVKASSHPSKSTNNTELTPDEKKVVAALEKRDREVHAHEAAHIGAGGGVVRGGASYSYQAGPDGKRYAVGGEVGIDASPVKDNPEATIRKMQVVRSAALAPADPSGQDHAVASAATAQMAAARAQLAEERSSSAEGIGNGDRSTLPNVNSYSRSGKHHQAEVPAVVDVQA